MFFTAAAEPMIFKVKQNFSPPQILKNLLNRGFFFRQQKDIKEKFAFHLGRRCIRY